MFHSLLHQDKCILIETMRPREEKRMFSLHYYLLYSIGYELLLSESFLHYNGSLYLTRLGDCGADREVDVIFPVMEIKGAGPVKSIDRNHQLEVEVD